MQRNKFSFSIVLVALTLGTAFNVYSAGGVVATAGNADAENRPVRKVAVQGFKSSKKEAIKQALDRFPSLKTHNREILLYVADKENSIEAALRTGSLTKINMALNNLVNGGDYLLPNDTYLNKAKIDLILKELTPSEKKDANKEKRAKKEASTAEARTAFVNLDDEDQSKRARSLAVAAVAVANKNKSEETVTVVPAVAQQAESKPADGDVNQAPQPTANIESTVSANTLKDESKKSEESKPEAKPAPRAPQVRPSDKNGDRIMGDVNAPVAPMPRHHKQFKQAKDKQARVAKKQETPSEPASELGSGSSSSSSAGSSNGSSPLNSGHNSEGEGSAEGSPTAKQKEAAPQQAVLGNADSGVSKEITGEEPKVKRSSRDDDNSEDPYRTKFYNSVKGFIKVAGPTVALLIGANWVRNAINNSRKAAPGA